MALRLEILNGSAIRPHLDGLAKLRMSVFRSWPYLYDGSIAYEAQYLEWFATSPGAIIIAAYDGEALVGASTAAALSGQMDAITAPYRARGADLNQVFYFGESVLLETYRGRGLGVGFFEMREAAARAFGGIAEAVFCAVIRAPDDPRRPAEYVPLDVFWRRRGFSPAEGMSCKLSWRETGRDYDSDHSMQFWRKELVA